VYKAYTVDAKTHAVTEVGDLPADKFGGLYKKASYGHTAVFKLGDGTYISAQVSETGVDQQALPPLEPDRAYLQCGSDQGVFAIGSPLPESEPNADRAKRPLDKDLTVLRLDDDRWQEVDVPPAPYVTTDVTTTPIGCQGSDVLFTGAAEAASQSTDKTLVRLSLTASEASWSENTTLLPDVHAQILSSGDRVVAWEQVESAEGDHPEYLAYLDADGTFQQIGRLSEPDVPHKFAMHAGSIAYLLERAGGTARLEWL
jgi:hypothetical protein